MLVLVLGRAYGRYIPCSSVFGPQSPADLAVQDQVRHQAQELRLEQKRARAERKAAEAKAKEKKEKEK